MIKNKKKISAYSWKDKKIYLDFHMADQSMLWKFFIDHFERFKLKAVVAKGKNKLYTYLGKTEYDACFLEDDFIEITYDKDLIVIQDELEMTILEKNKKRKTPNRSDR